MTQGTEMHGWRRRTSSHQKGWAEQNGVAAQGEGSPFTGCSKIGEPQGWHPSWPQRRGANTSAPPHASTFLAVLCAEPSTSLSLCDCPSPRPNPSTCAAPLLWRTGANATNGHDKGNVIYTCPGNVHKMASGRSIKLLRELGERAPKFWAARCEGKVHPNLSAK